LPIARFYPFDSISVQNDSMRDIEIKINGSDNNKITVYAGYSLTLMNQNYEWLLVKNLSNNSISANEITVIIGVSPKLQL